MLFLIVKLFILSQAWGSPRFEDKVALVTGGDSGIGLASVKAFYEECANVVMVGHNPEKTEKAFNDLVNSKPQPNCSTKNRAVWIAVDISNTSDVEKMMQFTSETFSTIDIVVNNAGVSGSDAKVGDDDFIDQLETYKDPLMVNQYGTLKCMNKQISYWLKHNITGIMVNVASICGERAMCSVLYSASKYSMIGFSQQAALTYAGQGIRINIVTPGAVNTTMLRDGLAPNDPRWLAKKAEIEKMIPSGRIAEPEELANTIAFLASDASSYMYGSILRADGGFLLK